MPPFLLRRVAAKNVQSRQRMLMKQTQEAYATANAATLEEALPCFDEKACIICAEEFLRDDGSGAEPVRHDGESSCTALVHESCMAAWRKQRDRKSWRVFTCPQCKKRLANVPQPPKRQKPICARPLGRDEWCKQPCGHLGEC